jgi:luciferase family oxidoreductase group 1
LSVLDLAFVADDSTPGEALRSTRDLAQHAESDGYRRFWLAEHHNAPSVSSAATAVAIGYVAEGTKAIRVGSGGVMLPNHSPLVIAEQFGTLASLYPGRIDLGVGRAPGTDENTLRALRRGAAASEAFPRDVAELRDYFGEPEPGQRVRAVPGAGLRVPVWILGSSLFGASLAASLGLPFAFAAHFAPDQLLPVLSAYRAGFRPSDQLERPYAMVSTNALVADTVEAARHEFTAYQQYMVNNIFRPPWRTLPPPIDDIGAYWAPHEAKTVSGLLRLSLVGSPETVRGSLADLAALSQADEIIVTAVNHDHAGRLRTLELLAQVRRELDRPRAPMGSMT